MLSDNELEALVPEMNIEAQGSAPAFDPVTQIQAASIDLRLGYKFWPPKKPRFNATISLSNLELAQMEISRCFELKKVSDHYGIVIKPGEMLLAHTLEKFTIPNGYSGILNGKSSISRLGLSIHCNGGFINPGWRGRMPLQLVNHGVVPIELNPAIPICQLSVFKNTTKSSKPYGTEGLGHSYHDEDGGPSRYWTCVALEKLVASRGPGAETDALKRASERIATLDDASVADRFIEYNTKRRPAGFVAERVLLERFAEHDTKRYKQRVLATKLLSGAVSLGCGAAITRSLFYPPYSTLDYIFWAVAFLAAMAAIYVFFKSSPWQPFTKESLADLYNKDA